MQPLANRPCRAGPVRARLGHARDRLLVCAGACLCLFAVVAYAVGASAALPFALVGGNILREMRRAPADRSPIWAETQ